MSTSHLSYYREYTLHCQTGDGTYLGYYVGTYCSTSQYYTRYHILEACYVLYISRLENKTRGSIPSNLHFDGNGFRYRFVRVFVIRFASYTLCLSHARQHQEPSERLGARKGVGEIKRHPFFESVHWALIANRKAPFPVWGPESPGWAESMIGAGNAPGASSRDDRMATWTWQASVITCHRCYSTVCDTQVVLGILLYAIQ